jgi:hypothetical protein
VLAGRIRAARDDQQARHGGDHYPREAHNCELKQCASRARRQSK